MHPPAPPVSGPSAASQHSESPRPVLSPKLRKLLWRGPLLLLVLLLELLTLPRHALAQSCTPASGTDWMIVTDPFAQDIRPRDCETVLQTPPDFRWPDVISSGSYQITLTYPDGHARTIVASQNWINWDEQLAPGTYAWTVSYAGGSPSKTRRFVVDSNSRPFLVPTAATMLATAVGKSHPRSLPDATTLAVMKSQRSGAVNQLLSDVSGRFTASLPSDGNADDAFQYSKYALNALMACAYTSQDSYCNDAIRRITNLASWNPTGTSSYTYAGADMGGRYLTWTVATGYDWLYPRLSSTQRSQILATLNTRTAQLYNDIIGTRARIAKAPRDSHANQTLSYLAVISTLLAGDLSAANTWLTNSLPLAINATNPWGGEEGGFANATTQGNWDLGELLPLWQELKLSTGVDMAQKAWVRNWGRYFTYVTPPGMAGGTTEFGDGFEENELEHQARFMKGYTNFAPSPLARWHASNLSAEDPTRFEFLMSPPADYTGSQPFPSGTPNGALFNYIGQVAMHSDLSNLSRTSVYFKSSPPPYGAFNHSHADQNSFVVNAGGQRLAIESGYYDNYKTQHWFNWYHTTQAKNAITYDGGQGQVFYEKDGKLGYGAIKRFTTSPSYDAVTGDATQAYNGALSLAQRTLVYLRPNLILVYDNLASNTSRQWEWNIHALNQMTSTSDTKATITAGGQTLCVSMLAGPAMHFTQTNQFTSDPSSGSWSPQWHGRFYSTTKSAATEFIALLDVGCSNPAANAVKNGSTWTVGLGSQTFTIGTDGSVAQVGGSTASGTTTGTTSTATTGTTSGTTSTYTPTTTTTSGGTLSGWTSGSTGTTTGTTSTTTTGTTSTSTTAASGGTTSLLPALTLPTTGVTAIPTFQSVGLYWQPGTNPGSAGCTLQYKKSTDTAWQNALAMWYDSRNTECRGSVVQLQPGTSYDFQLGLSGQAPSRQQRTTTWSENFPIARTVTLPPGTSSQTLNITQGGSPSGYVLYTTDPTAQSVIDSGNQQPYNVVISAPYVIVRGLVLKGAQADGIRIMDTAHDVVIENNDISGWGRSRGATSQFGYTLGVDMDSAIHAVCTTQNMVRTIVQRNKIHDPRYGANSWTEGHPLGPQGLSYESCGGNHVIRYNEIWSSTGHYYNDGLGGAENFSTVGFPNRDSDLYGNLIQNTWDDAIESEGGDMNVRIWGNYFNNTNTGAASTVDALGPLYIFRNVHNRSRQLEGTPLDQDERNVFAKSGSTSLGGGRRYIFHNTTLQATQSGVTNGLGVGSAISGTGSTQLIANTISRNNIFQLWKSTAPMVFQSGSGNDYGYDLYNGPAGVTETNGIQGVPVYATGNGWTSEANGMYQLASTSPGYDKGVRIPNFNDVYTGIAPDIGAHEAGTAAMVFGVKGGTATSGTTTGTSSGSTSGSTSGATSGTGSTTGTTSGGTSATPGTPTPYTGTPIALPGTFEAENFDKGGEGVAYHDTTPGNQGGQYRLAEDVDIVASSDPAGGGYVINGFTTGEWLAYTVNVGTSGQYVFELRVASNYTGTPGFHLEVDGAKVAAATVPNTGSWSNFQWVAAPRVTLTAGKHVLKIVSDQQYFNLNSVRATLVAATAGGSTPYNGVPVSVPATIEAENFDLGGEGVAHHDTTPGNQGGQYRLNEDVDIITSTDSAGGGYVVNNFANGEWLAYSINVPTAGNYAVRLRVSNNYASNAAFHVEVDGNRVTPSATVPMTGSWDTFTTVSAPAFALTAGRHVIKIVVDQQFFNFNSFVVATSP